MMEENKNFEDLFRESLESYELPYDASAWTSLEKNLPSKRKFNFLKWAFGGAAVLLLIGLASLIRYNNTADDSKTNLPLTENNSSESKNETKTENKTKLTEKTSSEKTVLNSPEESIKSKKIEVQSDNIQKEFMVISHFLN